MEYAYSRANRFDAVFWLRADEATILTSDFARVSRQLGLVDGEQDLVACEEAVLKWLAPPSKMSGESVGLANWLIIFDNADDLKVLEKYQLRLRGGSVLITSRDPDAKYFFDTEIEAGINLRPLAEKETKDLLRKLTHVRSTPSSSEKEKESEALSDLSRKLAGLPLLIIQVSARFRNKRLQSYSECLEDYTKVPLHQAGGSVNTLTKSADLRPSGRCTNFPRVLNLFYKS